MANQQSQPFSPLLEKDKKKLSSTLNISEVVPLGSMSVIIKIWFQ